MSLLFDNNLSPKLPSLLAADFPGSQHLRDCGLQKASDPKGATDFRIWEYALKEGLIIVSKDDDFVALNQLHGAPPKVVWVRLGNCTTKSVLDLLTTYAEAVRALKNSPDKSMLILPPP